MRLLTKLKSAFQSIAKNKTDIPFSVIVIIILALVLIIVIKIFWGDFLGLTNNILSEIVGLVVSVIIVGLILSNRWKLVQKRLLIRINTFVINSIFKIRLGFDILPEGEDWSGRSNIIEEIELIKNTDIKERLVTIPFSQLEFLSNLFEKIESDLLRVQSKADIKPLPDAWLIFDSLEESIDKAKNYLLEYSRRKKNANNKKTVTDKIFSKLIAEEIYKSTDLILNLKKLVQQLDENF